MPDGIEVRNGTNNEFAYAFAEGSNPSEWMIFHQNTVFKILNNTCERPGYIKHTMDGGKYPFIKVTY